MRRLVDNTVALVRSGERSVELAAAKLHDNGVPVAVIGRVLGTAAASAPAVTKAPPKFKLNLMPTRGLTFAQSHSVL
jgi:hypothetical protein